MTGATLIELDRLRAENASHLRLIEIHAEQRNILSAANDSLATELSASHRRVGELTEIIRRWRDTPGNVRTHQWWLQWEADIETALESISPPLAGAAGTESGAG